MKRLNLICLIILILFYFASIGLMFQSSNDISIFFWPITPKEKLIQIVKKKTMSATHVQFIQSLYYSDPEILYNFATLESLSFIQRQSFFEKALNQDPQNIQYTLEYLKFLIKFQKNEYAFKILSNSTKLWFPRLSIRNIQTSNPISPSYFFVFENNIFDKINTPKQIGKIFYFVGLEFLENNPKITADLWEISRQVNPVIGHYYTELINLYENRLDLPHKTDEIFSQCKLYDDPYQECLWAFTNKETLPAPGFMKAWIEEST